MKERRPWRTEGRNRRRGRGGRGGWGHVEDEGTWRMGDVEDRGGVEDGRN